MIIIIIGFSACYRWCSNVEITIKILRLSGNYDGVLTIKKKVVSIINLSIPMNITQENLLSQDFFFEIRVFFRDLLKNWC